MKSILPSLPLVLVICVVNIASARRAAIGQAPQQVLSNIALAIADPPHPTITTTTPTTEKTLRRIKPTALAERLTVLESDLWRNVDMDDMLDRLVRGDLELRRDSLDPLISLMRDVEVWVAHKILAVRSDSDRAHLIHGFIMTARECHRLNNFSGLNAMLSALHSPPIRRLLQAWVRISMEDFDILSNLDTFLHYSGKFGGYLRALGFTSAPCVPYLGAHMIAMLDVSKDIASEARTHMQNIKHCMAKPYDLMSRPLSNKAFSRKKAEDDADLLELSLEVEPSDAPIVAPGPFESRPGRSRFAQERPQRYLFDGRL